MAQTAILIGIFLMTLISFENNNNNDIQIATYNILNPIEEWDC